MLINIRGFIIGIQFRECLINKTKAFIHRVATSVPVNP